MTAMKIVQAQLDAYNAHDLDKFCACYSGDVIVKRLFSDETVFTGLDAFRKHYAAHRFNLPELHAELLERMELNDLVIDKERVTGTGDNKVAEVVAMYRVQGDKISHVWFSNRRVVSI